uniref:Uncharacterized protein n=1 Tax=viral metagenome TaxID=1070528 RepID=A0A6C0D7H6_9ZZZZ
MLPFSDMEPFFQNLQNNFVNTGLYMKVSGLNHQTHALWSVEEISQLLSFTNFERFKNSYELFRSSNIDVEYIQYKSFETSMKIYVKANRIVFSFKDSLHDVDLQEIRDFARNMNITNVTILLKL